MMNEKELDFLINFGTYKPKYLLPRIIFISLIASLVIFIVSSIAHESFMENTPKWKTYLLTIVAFNSITEINLVIVQLLAKSKWRWSIYLQSLIVLGTSILLILLWVPIAEKILNNDHLLKYQSTQIVFLVGYFIIIIHILFNVIFNLSKEWIINRKEITELKQTKLINDYNSLKDRLNPHFLFNNLSVLKSLIHFNPKVAEKFTQDFTNVYRYVLSSHEVNTVSLMEELKFMESYIALHKERIGEGLNVQINISEDVMQSKIPPMTLQLLVENAIKHNIANKSHPLFIHIYTENEELFVKNNLNKKESTYSTNTGLQTLKGQYKLIANTSIKLRISNTHFCVVLPLL